MSSKKPAPPSAKPQRVSHDISNAGLEVIHHNTKAAAALPRLETSA